MSEPSVSEHGVMPGSDPLPPLARILGPLVLAAAGALSFSATGLPLPFLFGPMPACLAAALLGERPHGMGQVRVANRTDTALSKPPFFGNFGPFRGPGLIPDGPDFQTFARRNCGRIVPRLTGAMVRHAPAAIRSESRTTLV